MSGSGSLFDLTDHVAVVTGGNSGIGLGIARGLADAGAHVAIWGRSDAKNEAAVKELVQRGGAAKAFACDVSEAAQVERALDATLEGFGRVDACFASAGLGGGAPLVEMSLEEWNRLLSVNLTGVFLAFRAAARHMVDRGEGGKLVAVSSIGAHFGMPTMAHYAACKGGVDSLVRSLAVELARHKIQVNSLWPGFIETPMNERARQHEKFYTTIAHRTPARRWGRPDDLQGAAVYLASRASDFHTGDVLRVDGGYTVF